jgi:hypothetical protein
MLAPPLLTAGAGPGRGAVARGRCERAFRGRVTVGPRFAGERRLDDARIPMEEQ